MQNSTTKVKCIGQSRKMQKHGKVHINYHQFAKSYQILCSDFSGNETVIATKISLTFYVKTAQPQARDE